MDTSTKIALSIFKKALEGENISNEKNEELYGEYKYNSSVQNELDDILDIFDIKIYDNANLGLHITPGVNNKTFGYSNEELRLKLGAKNNTELSTCYYLMYCILTRFYKESSLIASAEFITVEQVIADADSKVSSIKTMLESVNKDFDDRQDYNQSFNKLVSAWESISDVNINRKQSTIAKDTSFKAKMGFANKTLKFFCDNNLLKHDPIQNIYIAKPKLATIVGYYFDEHKTKNDIIEYLESLSSNNDNNFDLSESDLDYLIID